MNDRTRDNNRLLTADISFPGSAWERTAPEALPRFALQTKVGKVSSRWLSTSTKVNYSQELSHSMR